MTAPWSLQISLTGGFVDMNDIATKEAEALRIVKTFYQGAAEGRIVDFEKYLADDFILFVPDYLPWGG